MKIVLSIMLVVVISCVSAYAQKPSDTYKSLASALEAEKAAQKRWEAWEKERASMQQELDRLRIRLEYLKFQREQYSRYLEEAKQTINELKQRLEDSREFRMKLEPYLSDIARRLEEKVKNDLPFLVDERRHRLELVKQSLNEYDLRLSEKVRKVMEALLVEAKYGRTVEITDGTVDVEGRPRYVRFLRIGRLALFCATPDGGLVRRLNFSTGKWERVSKSERDQILKAYDIVDRKLKAGWIILPFEAPNLIQPKENQ